MCVQIFVIENDQEQRDLMSLLLEREGYEVRGAGSLAEARELLKQHSVEIVLSDYDLGDGTIDEAPELPLARTIIVSAQDKIPIKAAAVLRKPVALDELLDRIEELESAEVSSRPSRPSRPSQPVAVQQHEQHQHSDGSTDDQPALVLYVAEGSSTSERAQRKLKSWLNTHVAGHLSLDIRDVRTHVTAAAGDKIILTPTLVRFGPGPKAWLIGDMEDDAAVDAFLGPLLRLEKSGL